MGEYFSFIGIDFWTALFTLLNFLAVYFVGKHFLWGPVMKIIQDRQKEIDDLYADAGNARENALALEAEYKEKLSVATETGERIVQEAIVRGQTREEQIIHQANAEAAAILAKAEAAIALEKKKAINDAKDEISVIAVAIAEKVVARQINAADQDKLVNDFIDRLGDEV